MNPCNSTTLRYSSTINVEGFQVKVALEGNLKGVGGLLAKMGSACFPQQNIEWKIQDPVATNVTQVQQIGESILAPIHKPQAIEPNPYQPIYLRWNTPISSPEPVGSLPGIRSLLTFDGMETSVSSEVLESAGPKKRKRIPVMVNCSNCGPIETCQKRKGPKGLSTLCNACGLRYAKHCKRRGGEDINWKP